MTQQVTYKLAPAPGSSETWKGHHTDGDIQSGKWFSGGEHTGVLDAQKGTVCDTLQKFPKGEGKGTGSRHRESSSWAEAWRMEQSWQVGIRNLEGFSAEETDTWSQVDRHMGLSGQTHGAECSQCGWKVPLSLLQQKISCLLSWGGGACMFPETSSWRGGDDRLCIPQCEKLIKLPQDRIFKENFVYLVLFKRYQNI